MSQLSPRPSHLLQSEAWAEFQKSLGKQVFAGKGDGWSFQAILEPSESKLPKLGGNRLYVPYGPIAKDQNSLKQAVKALKDLAVEQQVAYVRMEPYPIFDPKTCQNLGLKKNARGSQPDLTWMLDLRQSEDQILTNMVSYNRRVWRRHQEFGLSFIKDNSPEGQEVFQNLMSATSKRTRSVFRSSDYMSKLLATLGQNGGIAFCEYAGKRLAGAFYADDPKTKTRYYLYAGSLDEAKKHNCASGLLSYLIFDAKKQSLEFFDFFGVSPAEAKNHPWAGYSSFKRSFGGQDVRFSGTWELTIKSLPHKLLRAARTISERRK